MRINKVDAEPETGGDLTPMIDMTFQLIAFFMLLLNFTEAEQDQRVTLPVSELAQPPESAYDVSLTVHVTGGGVIIFAAEDHQSLQKFHQALINEAQIIQDYDKKNLREVTVIIRADRNAKTGLVQEIIQTSQKVGFERFALRGKQGEIPLSQPQT